MAYTKREYETLARDARRLADGGDYEAAMALAQGKVIDLDIAGISGKYVDELRQVANRYERMFDRERDQAGRRELPYAG